MVRPFAVVIALAWAGFALAATVEDAFREVNGLLQTGKSEQAFVAAATAVRGNPESAQTLRPLAEKALSDTMTRVHDMETRKNYWMAIQLLHPMWGYIIDESSAGPLLPAPPSIRRRCRKSTASCARAHSSWRSSCARTATSTARSSMPNSPSI